MSRFCSLALLLSLFCLPLIAGEPSLTSDGIKVSLQGMDDFLFKFPQLQDESQKGLGKVIEQKLLDGGKEAIAKYDNDAEFRLVRPSNGVIEFSVVNPPAGLSKLRFETLVPFAMSEGGGYKIDGGAFKKFPPEKPEKPHVFQGNASAFELTAPTGDSFGIKELPPGSFVQVQDNRAWNWPIFHLMVLVPYNKDHAAVPLSFTSGKSTDVDAKKMVDKFGQDFAQPFPDKIDSEDDLKKDAATEQKYYDSFSKQKRDVFGGFPGTQQSLGLKKTGFFHVEKSGKRWFLVDPDGNAFFHVGICGFNPSDDFTYTEGREAIFEWLPPRTGEFSTAWHANPWWNERAFSFYVANLVRKYGKPYDADVWASRMIDRVRAFGFTSAGAFGGVPKAFAEKDFPYIRMFDFWGLGFDIPGARGFFDPFNPELAKKVDDVFSKTVAGHADEKGVIGYYLANEQAAEDLPKALAALDGSFAVKKELVAFLKKKYGNKIQSFNTAWKMDVKSFDDLTGRGLPLTTDTAKTDIKAFTGLFLDKYYSLLRDTFRKYDKNHLLLGSRWQPQSIDEQLVKTCEKYCDVISVNYYTDKIDKAYLDKLRGWAGDKPFLLSEWHYTCPAESGLPGGHGNRNTQKERGLAYRNYVETAASLPYVVGVEWFTLVDQARAGRFFEKNTGERSNTGLFSVTDRPWKDFVTEAAKTNAAIEKIVLP